MEDTIETLTSEKQRHGCLTAWLIFMIVINTVTPVSYLIAKDKISQNFPGGVSDTILYVFVFMGIVNILFAILLLKWKKIGFWGFLIISFVVFSLNLYKGSGILPSSLGLLGIVILFGLLMIKKDGVSAWKNLE